jgi:hypothetical protein
VFLWLLVVLSFALYLLANVVLSVVASLGARFVRRAGRELPAGVLFAFRVAPALAALSCVGALFLPSFLALEPRQGVETPGRPLLLLASAAAALFGFTLVRAGLAFWRTAGLVRSWVRDSPPRTLDGGGLLHEVQAEFPIVAAVGTFRPRFVAARQVVDALSAAELDVALAHERAHVRARDNVKRLALSALPDVFGSFPDGQWVEASWEQAAERAADREATRGSRERALELCGALLKVARLIPEGAGMPAPFAALHAGGDLADRVSRLLEDPKPVEAGGGRPLALVVGACVALSLLLASLGTVHEITEALVKALR